MTNIQAHRGASKERPENTMAAFRRAEELALAMECRCYHGGKGRTRMKQLHLTAADFIACAVMAAMIAGLVLLNRLPIPW